MQGDNSSAAMWTALLDESTAYYSRPVFDLKISWLRNVTSGVFATVGTSVVDGDDLVKGVQADAVTKPDAFQYFNESERAMVIETESSFNDEIGGITYGRTSIVMDNSDNRFTYGVDSTIGTAILPKRPHIVSLGYYLSRLSIEQPIPIFKGISGSFKEDKTAKTVEFNGLDYISFFRDKKIESSIYIDKRTDEILDDIFTNDLGLGSSQYVLDTGLNTISFAWFTREDTVGKRLDMIVSAEQGHLYQDENGIIRFETRQHYTQSPHNASVHTIHASDIIRWNELERTPIINVCRVKAKPRSLQSTQEVWRLGIVEEIPASGSLTIWAQFEDPVTSLSTFTANTDYTFNSASDGTGADLTGSITPTVTLFTDTAKIELSNGSATTAYLTFGRLRGTPATITSEIEAYYSDDDSINKFDEQEKIIENDFIDSTTFAKYLARATVQKFSQPRRRARLLIRCVPHLQVKDYVTVEDPDSNTTINFRILEIRNSLLPGEMTQELLVREISGDETDQFAIVGTSTVGGSDLVGI